MEDRGVAQALAHPRGALHEDEVHRGIRVVHPLFHVSIHDLRT